MLTYLVMILYCLETLTFTCIALPLTCWHNVNVCVCFIVHCTRQMIIIVGGEPEPVWHGAAQHAKWAVCITCVHVLSGMWCAHVVLYAEKCEERFVWSDQQEKLMYVKAEDGDTDKEAQEWKSFLMCCGVQLIQTVWLCHIADLASSPCFQLAHT